MIEHPLALACFMAAAVCFVGVAFAVYAAIMVEGEAETTAGLVTILLLSILGLALMAAGRRIATGVWYGL